MNDTKDKLKNSEIDEGLETKVEQKNVGGRPRKDIPPEYFKKLCQIQCTITEIAGFFECHTDTIQAFCKREFDMSFSQAYKMFSESGKASLRHLQWQSAKRGSVPMQIWLGKQFLGQKDKIEGNINFRTINEEIAELEGDTIDVTPRFIDKPLVEGDTEDED